MLFCDDKYWWNTRALPTELQPPQSRGAAGIRTRVLGIHSPCSSTRIRRTKDRRRQGLV